MYTIQHTLAALHSIVVTNIELFFPPFSGGEAYATMETQCCHDQCQEGGNKALW